MSPYFGLSRTIALALPIALGAWTVQAADIIQTAKQVGRFDRFLHLVEAAGMVEVLKGKGPSPFSPRSMKLLANYPRMGLTGF